MDLLGHNVDVLGYILFIIHLFFIYSTLKCKKDERKKSTGRRSKISERGVRDEDECVFKLR